MWNSDRPFELFQQMSKEITGEDLKRLQQAINEDKETESNRQNRDVCGDYAPFCEYCNKNLSYPCAQAYIKMKSEEGCDVSVAEPYSSESVTIAEEPNTSDSFVETNGGEEETKPKKYIRIAHIRRTK